MPEYYLSPKAIYRLPAPAGKRYVVRLSDDDGETFSSFSASTFVENSSASSGGITWASEPANSSSSGNAGDVAYGGLYFYVHNGTQWNRVLLSSFGDSGGGGGGGNVTTYRLLTEGSDTLLSEGGDYLGHDGSGTTTSGNWTQVYGDIDGAAAGSQIQQAALTSNGTNLFVAAPQQTQLRMFIDNGTAWAEQTSEAFSLSLTGGLWPTAVSVSSDGSKVLTLASSATESGNGTAFHAVLLAEANGWSEVGRIYSTEDFPSLESLALSGDGLIAIASTSPSGYGPWGDSRRLMLCDAASGLSELATVGGFNDGLSKLGLSVAIDGDGSRIAATYSTGVFNWDGLGYTWNGSPEREGVKTFAYSGGSLIEFGGNLTGAAGTDAYGQSLSFSDDGNRLAIGAPYGSAGGTERGYVRVYDWSGSAWVQAGSDIVGTDNGDRVGSSVDLSASGNRLVVGLRLRDGNGTNSGATRVYDWTGSAWVQVGSDIAGDASNDYSGSFVALSGDGDRVAIGAPGNDDGGSEAGQVKVYEQQ